MFSAQVAEWNSTRDAMGSTSSALAQVLRFATQFRDVTGKRLDESGPVDGQSYSFKEAVLHAQRAMRSFEALKLDKNKPIPTSAWQAALAAVAELRDASASLLSMVTTISTEGRPLAATNGSSIMVRETGEQIANLTAPATRLVAAGDSLTQSTATLLNSVRASDLARNNQEAAVVADDAKASAQSAIKAEEASRMAVDAAARVADLLAEISATKASTEARVTASSATLSEQVSDLSTTQIWRHGACQRSLRSVTAIRPGARSSGADL